MLMLDSVVRILRTRGRSGSSPDMHVRNARMQMAPLHHEGCLVMPIDDAHVMTMLKETGVYQV